MSKIPVKDMKGSACGELEIPDNLLVFDKGGQAVQDVIVAYQAGLRAGTACTKGKGDVAGSNKKPWKQKGLGRARAGYRQSPVWTGGAVVFGPKPRDYSKKVNRKTARLAFHRAFSERVRDAAITVVDRLDIGVPKTKALATVLKALQMGPCALIVLEKLDVASLRAVRNLPRVEMVAAKDVHTWQLLRYPAIMADKAAIGVIEKRLRDAGGQ